LHALVGQVIALTVGLIISHWLGPMLFMPGWLQQTSSATISIALMSWLGVVHPPAGASAMVFGSNVGHSNPMQVTNALAMMVANVIAIVLGTVINNFNDKRQYPTFWMGSTNAGQVEYHSVFERLGRIFPVGFLTPGFEKKPQLDIELSDRQKILRNRRAKRVDDDRASPSLKSPFLLTNTSKSSLLTEVTTTSASPVSSITSESRASTLQDAIPPRGTITQDEAPQGKEDKEEKEEATVMKPLSMLYWGAATAFSENVVSKNHGTSSRIFSGKLWSYGSVNNNINTHNTSCLSTRSTTPSAHTGLPLYDDYDDDDDDDNDSCSLEEMIDFSDGLEMV